MGKVFNSFIISAMIQLSLLLFDDGGTAKLTPILGLMLRPAYSGLTGTSGSVIDILTSFFSTGLGLAGVAALVIGTIWIKQDWLVRGGFFVTFFSWVIFPMIDFWNTIASKVSSIPGISSGCLPTSTSKICGLIGVSGFGGIIASLIAGPLIVYAMWACLEYIWGGDR